MPYVAPGDGEVVGIGEPVAIRFDENIADRAAAQKAIKITTNPPVEGAFYWLNNREVRWRPEHFWKPGTAVDVAVNTYGVDLGDGMFGEDNVKTHFTIGDEVISTADDTTKMVTVGSTAKSSRPCRRRWVRTARRRTTASTSSAAGSTHHHGFVDLRRSGQLAQRISHRSRLGHADVLQRRLRALRALVGGAQGHTNTSHGCLNVSPSNAEWFYDHSKSGDIVEVVNTVGRRCRAPRGSATGTSPGRSGRRATPTPDVGGVSRPSASPRSYSIRSEERVNQSPEDHAPHPRGPFLTSVVDDVDRCPVRLRSLAPE